MRALPFSIAGARRAQKHSAPLPFSTKFMTRQGEQPRASPPGGASKEQMEVDQAGERLSRANHAPDAIIVKRHSQMQPVRKIVARANIIAGEEIGSSATE
jgi:hypothetical protein